MVMLMIVPNKTHKFNYCENLEKLFFFGKRNLEKLKYSYLDEVPQLNLPM